jgi:hypothetical protein
MAEYHTVYKGPEGETTQWEDIQRKHGNLPPKAPVWKPEKYRPETEQVRDQDWVDNKEAEELEELEDEFPDDRFMEEYRCSHWGPGRGRGVQLNSNLVPSTGGSVLLGS